MSTKYKVKIGTREEVRDKPLNEPAYQRWLEVKDAVKAAFLVDDGFEVDKESFTSAGRVTIGSYVLQGVGAYVVSRETTRTEDRRVDMNITLASTFDKKEKVDGLVARLLTTTNDILRKRQPVEIYTDNVLELR